MSFFNDVRYGGNSGRNKKDDYHRVLHLVEKALQKRVLFRFGKLVFSVLLKALCGLLTCQAVF